MTLVIIQQGCIDYSWINGVDYAIIQISNKRTYYQLFFKERKIDVMDKILLETHLLKTKLTMNER